MASKISINNLKINNKLLDYNNSSGTDGQVLTSSNNGSNITWNDPQTYTNGTGVNLDGTQFSIGQSVANTDSPNFTNLTVGNTGTNQGIINLQDVTDSNERTTFGQIKVVKNETTNGGKFVIRLKTASNFSFGDGMSSRLGIDYDGATTIYGVLSANGLKTDNPIHIGTDSGEFSQSTGAVAIGPQAGNDRQGANAIAIGKEAGKSSQHANTIVLNAQGTALNTGATDGFYVAPIGSGITGQFLQYNTSTKEITYGDLPLNIDATKIADGSISNTEFQHLNGVTSAIQTQLDGKAVIPDGDNNELLKRVDANNVGGTNILNVVNPASSNVSSNTLTYYDGDGDYVSSISHVKDDSVPADVIHKVNILPNAFESQYLTILHSTGDSQCRVGINIANPEEALDIEGNIQLASGGTGKIKYKDASAGHIHSELDSAGDGTSGGKFIVKTKEDGGNVTDKLTINNKGALGIGATPSYGTAGNFLMSQGSGQAPEWFVPTTRIITSVKKTNSQTFTSGGVTKIIGWDTPHVDIGTTGWSNANSRYTIQRTGTYRIYLKTIVTNTDNTQASLRYLNIGMLIYNSGGGSPVIQDLDTTTLVNVDNTDGNAERGSGDYSIIRTFNAGQYIEFQVVSFQATGNYAVESAVFNIEEVGSYYVAGVGQFFTLTDGNALQTKVNNLNNFVINICSDADLKTGNATTVYPNNNTINAWLPLYTQGNDLRLSHQITLNDATRPVKIETNVVVLINRTHVGFRVSCNNGTSVNVVPGSTNWKSTAASGDDDTPAYCTSIVHNPGGTGTLTYTIEAYVLARFEGEAPIAIFNASLDSSIALRECTMLITEL